MEFSGHEVAVFSSQYLKSSVDNPIRSGLRFESLTHYALICRSDRDLRQPPTAFRAILRSLCCICRLP